MKRVEWAQAATDDLQEIRDYLGEHYGEKFAQWNIDTLVLAAEWLLDWPHAGPAIGYGTWRKWKPRKQRHILVYEPDKDGIIVVRVRHESSDWKPVPD